MSTLRICIELESNDGGLPPAEVWNVSIVRYSPDWTPRHWRDEPGPEAVAPRRSALSGISRELADCYTKAFNTRELKRPKRCWAVREQATRDSGQGARGAELEVRSKDGVEI